MARSVVLILLVCACLAQAGDRVGWMRPPAYITDDVYVDYQVRVEPHADNRWLTVAAYEGDLPVRVSGPTGIDGHSASRHFYRWRLPAGELTLLAQVQDRHGTVYRDTAPVTVIHVGP